MMEFFFAVLAVILLILVVLFLMALSVIFGIIGWIFKGIKEFFNVSSKS